MPNGEEVAIDRLLAILSLEEKAAQLCMPALGRDGLDMVEEVHPGGVILFGENIRDADQIRTLVEELQMRSDLPLLIAIDHEGGVVDRLAHAPGVGATAMPAAAVVGRTGDPSLAYEIGRTMARELRGLGITVNLAPVADLRTNPTNSVIGTRSYGAEPSLVADMVVAMVRGLEEENVSATLKHFPGHGDSGDDTHFGPVMIGHDLQRLRAVELAPFAAGIDAGCDFVLTAHIAFPAITGTQDPATVSSLLIEGLLRGELGFDGVVITDSLAMRAIAGIGSPEEVAERAIAAGADMILQPVDPRATRDRIVEAVREGRLSPERLDLSVRRVLRVKFRRGLLKVSEHEAYDSRFAGIVQTPNRYTTPGGGLENETSRALVDRVRHEGGSR